MSTYVYGVVSDEHPMKIDHVRGVGRPPMHVRVVAAGPLRAVVSDAPDDLRAKRRDLLAHEEVLETLCEQGATLPMRFGLVAEDDDEVAREVSAKQTPYLELLAELDGKAELNVKATHHEDAVLRELLVEHDELRRMNEDMRQRGGGTPHERMAFGEHIAAVLHQRQRRDAEVILAPLREFAVAESNGPEVDECFVNTSFLVERKRVPEFEATVAELSETMCWLIELRMQGPLPPYSFTEVSPHSPKR